MEDLKVRVVKQYVVVCPWHSFDEKSVYINQGECKMCRYCVEYKSKEFVKCNFNDKCVRLSHNGEMTNIYVDKKEAES
jgi:NAD-dependent dihydropyrimidine dehydrogenase PreA subunit